MLGRIITAIGTVLLLLGVAKFVGVAIGTAATAYGLIAVGIILIVVGEMFFGGFYSGRDRV